ncbi:MAG: chorismate mutase [Sneathiellales bacterium]|nr:chorismate mutase [Sneathiellales bacterium]
MTRKAPTDCVSMAELRPQIDSIDNELIELLFIRSRYIDRAVDLKRIENLPARTTDRVAEVIGNVRKMASERGLDPQLAETLWHELIEWSIAREAKHLG